MGEETGERERRGNCSQDMLYERRIRNNNKHTKKKITKTDLLLVNDLSAYSFYFLYT